MFNDFKAQGLVRIHAYTAWDGGKWVALSPHPNDTTAQRLDEKGVSRTYLTDSMGRKQSTTVINESGLYNVILRSDKPETI